MEILMELQKVNARLDAVEYTVAQRAPQMSKASSKSTKNMRDSPQLSKKSKHSSSALQKCKTKVLYDNLSHESTQSNKKSKYSSSALQKWKTTV